MVRMQSAFGGYLCGKRGLHNSFNRLPTNSFPLALVTEDEEEEETVAGAHKLLAST